MIIITIIYQNFRDSYYIEQMKNKKRKLKQDIQNLIRYIIHILMYRKEKITAGVYNCKIYCQ